MLSVQALARAARGDAVQFGLLGEQLRVIWEDLLHTTNIGPDDDFMELGGTSLLSWTCCCESTNAAAARCNLRACSRDP
jgi:hypothetical protein